MNTVPFPLQRILPLAVLLVLSACASVPAPVSELAAAQQAITNAVAADARQYASEDVARAQALFQQAQALLGSGQNDQARQLAWRASAAADLATARSHNLLAQETLRQRSSEIAELRRRLQQETLP